MNKIYLFFIILSLSIPAGAENKKSVMAKVLPDPIENSQKAKLSGWEFVIQQVNGQKDIVKFIDSATIYQKSDKDKPTAKVFGKVNSDLTVFYNNEIVSNKDEKNLITNTPNLNLIVPLISNGNTFSGSFDLTVLNTKGELKSCKYIVTYLLNRKDRKTGLRLGTNITNVSYSQSNQAANYGATFITVKGGFYYSLTDKIALDSNLSLDVLPLSVRSDQTLRFLKANLDGEWELPLKSQVWIISAKSGIYYQTTFSFNGNIGFQNMFGPEVHLKIKRILSKDRYLAASFKYALIPNNVSWLSFGNNELETSFSYNFSIKNTPTELSTSFGLANVNGLDSSNSFNYKTITGGISFGF